ncbi:MAG TPA: methylmalonyl-CoA epimerase [Patescibacteria group bacterium]|nr:methylmalonyl-CoA epimerase [Patescibacteria group bacterium]
MIKSLNHIGIAVRDLEASVELFKKIFQTQNIHREVVEEQKVSIASFKVGDVILELTAPTSPESPIAKFIEKRGEGIHHLAFKSDNVATDLERLKGENIQLINEKPQPGAHDMLIAFMHPKSTGGVLMELCQDKI